jgi:hypothetical protein
MKTSLVVGTAMLALVVVAVPQHSFGDTATKTCYNCDNFFGPWECKSGGFSGGTECTVGQDSCTVKGNCSSSGSSLSGVTLSMDRGFILDVAARHPRAAATLHTLASSGTCGDISFEHWHNDVVTIDDVETLIDEGTIGLEPSGPAVIYEITIEPYGAEGDLLLKLVPVQPSDLDPQLTELLVHLTPELPEGPYVPVYWELIS